ncbi:glycosyltransferase family 4 protein [archaeon]|jgi:glycosyltransferase involved in cell wall biosynthesis|nr:glycosyltransferase family 4 protein [archaeon]MBT3730558.1 glycosyltransferase family 4 protein [archaeon]MBT4669460.1 glycosyltransferase family 4 protein [archaeon]MBT5030217.1 glycosyltransferase family 4 protein [archaeon]MBT5287684.1 glycosyltransferase family 4 protein [archaeon]
MKIAMLNTFYLPTVGGVEKVMEELAVRYIEKGHEVDVYCADTDKYKRLEKKFEVIEGVNIYRSRYILKLSLNTYIFPGFILDLLFKDYDVVHTHRSAHDFVMMAGLISFIRGKVHINTTHCPWTDKFRPWTVRLPLFFTDRFFNYISFFFVDKVVAITPWEIPILKRWVSKRKIKVIRNGTDKVLFERIKNNQFKKKHGVKDKLVLFFGRLHPTKAPHVLAEVAKEIVNERKDIDFVFVGPDEGEMDKVKGIVKGEKRIQVLGPLFGKKNIAEMYQASDVYVLPSYREGLPLTIFEAMASGLPIVATPCNGIPFEMDDNVNGFLVEFGNKKLLKEKILKVLDDKKLAKKFSENNLKKAEAYTWDAIAEETLELYDTCIKRKKLF